MYLSILISGHRIDKVCLWELDSGDSRLVLWQIDGIQSDYGQMPEPGGN